MTAQRCLLGNSLAFYIIRRGNKSKRNFQADQLKTALSSIRQDCGQWVKSPSQFSSSSSTPLNMPLSHTDNRPNGIPNSNLSHVTSTSFSLKERCTGADTISLITRLLQNSKAHLHSIFLQNNAAIVDDFYVHLKEVGDEPVDEEAVLLRALGERRGWKRGIGRKLRRGVPDVSTSSRHTMTSSEYDEIQATFRQANEKVKQFEDEIERLKSEKGGSSNENEDEDED